MLNPYMPDQELRLHMGELTANEMLVARAAIAWANSQAIPEGYALVPIEPTEIQQDAGTGKIDGLDYSPYDAGMIYKAMIAAAQSDGKGE